MEFSWQTQRKSLSVFLQHVVQLDFVFKIFPLIENRHIGLSEDGKFRVNLLFGCTAFGSQQYLQIFDLLGVFERAALERCIGCLYLLGKVDQKWFILPDKSKFILQSFELWRLKIHFPLFKNSEHLVVFLALLGDILNLPEYHFLDWVWVVAEKFAYFQQTWASFANLLVEQSYSDHQIW